MEKRKISLAITTYNRPELTIKAFENVLYDDRISEIIILDDCSNIENYYKLRYKINLINTRSKVKLYVNEQNEGMSLNKKKAIELCENEWVIIFDSDNIIDSSYIDALHNHIWLSDIIYCPEKGFSDYSEYAGTTLDKQYIKWKLCVKNEKKFNWLANTGNYFVHRETYLKNYVYNPEIKQADTIWHMYNHLRNNGRFFIVPNMSYEHLIHDGSGWRQNRKENVKKFNEIKELIRML